MYLSISILIGYLACVFAAPTGDDNYAVLFDAGSSSTKLKVYSWSQGAHVPYIDLLHSQRFSPGLSEYDNNVDGLKTYLVEILNAAKEKVPEDKQSQTPLFLMATAGLRFLTADDAASLIANTRDVLKDISVSPFVYKASKIDILSGEEEGVYAWLAANYLNGFFDEIKPASESTGVLEMGGGSMQITFIPESPLYAGEFHVEIAGSEYDLYVHSYLQYGLDAINLKIAHALAKKTPFESTLQDPCRLRGDDDKLLTLDDGTEVTLQGASNPEECQTIFEEILDPETGIECEPKPCAIGNVYQPGVGNDKFFATQGFTYAPNTLGVIGEDKILIIPELKDAAHVFCQKDIDGAVESGVKKELASATCMAGIYIPVLFTESYGFPEDTANIKVLSDIDGKTIDWALGALLIELANENPSGEKCTVTKVATNAVNDVKDWFSG